MRKIIFTGLLVVFLFIIEFFIFNLAGRIFVPNLLLLLTVFITLVFGIRYGLLSAILSGILKDSFSSYVFGVNIFVFVLCAFAVVFLKRRVYHGGSNTSRLLLVFIILVLEMSAITIIHWMFGPIHLGEIINHVFFPEVILTLIVTPLVFEELKKCVLKLFVL